MPEYAPTNSLRYYQAVQGYWRDLYQQERKMRTPKANITMMLHASMKNSLLTAIDINKEVAPTVSIHTVTSRLIEGGRLAVKPVCKPMLTLLTVEVLRPCLLVCTRTLCCSIRSSPVCPIHTRRLGLPTVHKLHHEGAL